jgi:hypothetical protein
VIDGKVIFISRSLIIDNDYPICPLLNPVDPRPELEGILDDINLSLKVQDLCLNLLDLRHLVIHYEILQMVLHLVPEKIDLTRRVFTILLLETFMDHSLEFL